MKRLILTLAALAAVSACSDSRERSAPGVNQVDRPLLVAPPDTSNKVASDIASRGDQPVSPVEQQVPRAEPTPKARPIPRPQRRAAVRPKPPVDTTSSRGYAPITNTDTVTSADTSTVRDTGSAQPLDTARATTPDTTTSVPAADTVATAPTETLPADTAQPSPAPDSAVASSATSSGQASDASSLDDASRRTLPIGTEIHAALDDSISSRRDSAGRSISAEISQSVTGAGGRSSSPPAARSSLPSHGWPPPNPRARKAASLSGWMESRLADSFRACRRTCGRCRASCVDAASPRAMPPRSVWEQWAVRCWGGSSEEIPRARWLVV